MTLKEILTITGQELENKKIEQPYKEAIALISLVTNFNESEIISNYQTIINPLLEKRIKQLTKKRIQGWSLACLKGRKSFYNLDFIVDKNTLIPRPESELIIDNVIKEKMDEKKNIIIDVGTGSGCLIISLANIFRTKKNISFYATDTSQKALDIAKINAKNYKLKIKFFKGNLLKPLLEKDSKKFPNNAQIIILANLPYLTKAEIKNSPSIKKEPFKALYGGSDGLNLHRQLLDQVIKLKNKKNEIILYQEINNEQKTEMEKIITNKLNNFKPQINIIKDLNNYNRLIITRF